MWQSLHSLTYLRLFTRATLWRPSFFSAELAGHEMLYPTRGVYSENVRCLAGLPSDVSAAKFFVISAPRAGTCRNPRKCLEGRRGDSLDSWYSLSLFRFTNAVPNLVVLAFPIRRIADAMRSERARRRRDDAQSGLRRFAFHGIPYQKIRDSRAVSGSRARYPRDARLGQPTEPATSARAAAWGLRPVAIAAFLAPQRAVRSNGPTNL